MNIEEIRKSLQKDENGLLPCGHCESKAIEKQTPTSTFYAKPVRYYVACSKSCVEQDGTFETPRQATESWNTRPSHVSDLLANNERLEEDMQASQKSEETNDKLYDVAIKALEKCQAQLTAEQEKVKGLKEFARCVITDWCWGSDSMDGCDMQDFAESFGLIAEHTATEADVDEESDYEVGDKIYKFTEVITAS